MRPVGRKARERAARQALVVDTVRRVSTFTRGRMVAAFASGFVLASVLAAVAVFVVRV